MAATLESDIQYLKSLRAVRERSRIVLEAARNGGLSNFELDESWMKETAEFVAGVISVSVTLLSRRLLALFVDTRVNYSETLAPTDMQRSRPMDDGSILVSAAFRGWRTW
jgi:hypothetical protein